MTFIQNIKRALKIHLFKNRIRKQLNISQKRIFRWQMKRCSTSSDVRKMRNLTAWHLSQESWSKKKVVTLNLVRMHGNQIIHTLLVGMEAGAITLGNNLTASYKAKHTTTMPPSSSTPEHVSWEWKLPFTRQCIHECS